MQSVSFFFKSFHLFLTLYLQCYISCLEQLFLCFTQLGGGSHSQRRGVLPYMGYIAMCHCEGYGFQAVYSGTGYINQRLEVG